MNKILLELYIPASGKFIEIRVPRQIKVADLRNMLMSYLINQEDSDYIPSNNTLICDFDTGKPYNWNLFVEQLQLKNGSRIMII